MEIPRPSAHNTGQPQQPGYDITAHHGGQQPEVADGGAPTAPLQALGGAALGHDSFIDRSIGNLKVGEEFEWGQFDQASGKNVINTTTFHGLDASRNLSFTTVAREVEQANRQPAITEEASTEVLPPPRPSAEVRQPETGPRATTARRERTTGAIARAETPSPAVQREAYPVEEDEDDFSTRTYKGNTATDNQQARAAAAERRRPAPERTEPGARTAAAAAEVFMQEPDDGIPHAVEPEDLRDSGPRPDSRPIQYE